MPLSNHITQDVNGRRLTYALTLVNDEPVPETNQTGKEVFHGTPIAPKPDSDRRAIGIVGGERVYLHFVDGPEPGFVVGKKCLLNPHVEPPTQSIKERIIEGVLQIELVEPDLKPAIRERALDTFNGFQGTPLEKATLAINHAYIELTVKD